MLSIELLGLGIVVGMSLLFDADGTVKLVTTIISIRGVTWIVKKITNKLDLDYSEFINFAGWGLVGVSCVKIIKNAVGSVDKISTFVVNTGNSIANFFDKLTFWN